MTTAPSQVWLPDPEARYSTLAMLSALRKSAVRRSVLRYLASIHPRESYISDIGRAIRYATNQVYGALLGTPNAYEPTSSLCSLGLVERIGRHDGRGAYYRATRLGCSVSDELQSR